MGQPRTLNPELLTSKSTRSYANKTSHVLRPHDPKPWGLGFRVSGFGGFIGSRV